MGEAGLGDQGSLFGGGEVGRGMQRLGVSGGQCKDRRMPIMAGAKVEKGSPAAGNLKEPTSEDSAILGTKFSSSWEQ